LPAARTLDVGVVGGSIAGCFAALELLDAGHRVTVFERSDAELHGLLGAGLGTPTPTFQMLVDRGLVDRALPHVALSEMLFISPSPGERRGRIALRRPLIFAAFHWGDLHRGLRARMPAGTYRAGHAVASVAQAGEDHAAVRLADGSQHRFDLVVCADGYHSLGRRQLFAKVEPEYHGYICWRGVLEERAVSDAHSIGSSFARFGTTGLPGSFLYPIPGADGSVEVGERLVNWGCYVPVAAAELGDLMVGRDRIRYPGTIPPGELRPDDEARFKALAFESLPPLYAEIVAASRATFAQAIHSVTVPAYHRGRICLTGDAAAVTPPFTGSGIFKAATNAIRLRAALDAHEDVDGVLAGWDAAETKRAWRLLELGRQYDAAFIERPPDFASMSSRDAAAWWARAVQHPDFFTFEAES
jgi:2-polyprenyl-6-methoxyphenol hydroxylase-like FAD-dependent oxidoreductase